jgi:hypothetical protein
VSMYLLYGVTILKIPNLYNLSGGATLMGALAAWHNDECHQSTLIGQIECLSFGGHITLRVRSGKFSLLWHIERSTGFPIVKIRFSVGTDPL